MDQFKEIKIRVCAVIQCDDQIALIHRRKNNEDSYTIPGGNVDPGEDITNALKRELNEELDINFAYVLEEPVFLAVQDQMVSRPGATPPPRKLHMIFQLAIEPKVKELISGTEMDDLGEGNIVWMSLKDASKVHLYPAAGALLEELSHKSSGEKVLQPKLLPAMTNRNFSWR